MFGTNAELRALSFLSNNNTRMRPGWLHGENEILTRNIDGLIKILDVCDAGEDGVCDWFGLISDNSEQLPVMDASSGW